MYSFPKLTNGASLFQTESFRLRKDALNVLYCYTHVCHLGATAAVEFASKGYPVMEMDGGFEAWKENDLEIEKGEAKESRKNFAAANR